LFGLASGPSQALQKDITALSKNKKLSKADRKAEADRLQSGMEERHARELLELGGEEGGEEGGDEAASGAGAAAASASAGDGGGDGGDAAASTGAKKVSKGAKRRAKKEAEAREREEAIARADADLARAGGSRRDKELRALGEALSPLGLAVVGVPADGSCLFHALSDQLEAAVAGEARDAASLRELAAASIAERAASIGPFLPFEAADGDFASDPDAAVASYCGRLRSSRLWGGQPEIMALAAALGRDVVVHSAGEAPLVAEGGPAGAAGRPPALQITFHRHYISSGEHYNSARPTAT